MPKASFVVASLWKKLTESDYGLKDGAGDWRDTQKCHVNRKKQIQPPYNRWLTILFVANSTLISLPMI